MSLSHFIITPLYRFCCFRRHSGLFSRPAGDVEEDDDATMRCFSAHTLLLFPLASTLAMPVIASTSAATNTLNMLPDEAASSDLAVVEYSMSYMRLSRLPVQRG